MLKNRKILLVTTLALCTSCVPSFAAQLTTGGRILTLVPLARPAGMGGAFCAVADDVNTLLYNPAGLGTLDCSQLNVSEHRPQAGVVEEFGAFAYNLRDVRSENVQDMGTIAAAITYLDAGDVPDRYTGESTGTPFRAKDEMLTISYGKPVFEQESFGRISVGGSAKFVEEQLISNTAKNTVFDAGLLWQNHDSRLSAGAALLNFGRKLSYKASEFDLPTVVKTGVAFRTLDDSLLLAADATSPLHDDVGRCNLGAEYFTLKSLALRLGYDSHVKGSGLTYGAGFIFKQVDIMFVYAREIDIDYAYTYEDTLGDIHRLSLTLKLGAD